MSDDLEALEDVAALFERRKATDRRIRTGMQHFERCAIRGAEKQEYLRKFGKGGTRKKVVPITLAGPKS